MSEHPDQPPPDNDGPTPLGTFIRGYYILSLLLAVLFTLAAASKTVSYLQEGLAQAGWQRMIGIIEFVIGISVAVLFAATAVGIFRSMLQKPGDHPAVDDQSQ